jgi:uncharacterized membrane protein YbhN (UPF0104 family)
MSTTTVLEPMTTSPAQAGSLVTASATRRRAWRLFAGGLVVALLGVEIVLAAPMLGSAITALRQARPAWIAAAVAAEIVSMDMFARLRRRLMASAGVRVGVRDTLGSIYVANALHMTMPGGAAFSTAYVYRWMRERGAGGAASTWTLIAGGLLATSGLGALAVAASLLVGATSGLVALGVDIVLVLALVAGVRALRSRPELPVVLGRRVLRRVNVLLRRPVGRGADALAGWVMQFHAVRPRGRDWAAGAAYGLGTWVFDAVCLAAAAAAVGASGLTVAGLLVAYTAGMAASSLSLLPGGIGVVDAAMVLALVAGGVPAAAALPAVLLYRLISLVGVVAVGWVVAALRGHRERTARPAVGVGQLSWRSPRRGLRPCPRAGSGPRRPG